MDKITIERVEFTKCPDCIFYSRDIAGCSFDGCVDSDHAPFACTVDDKYMMWIKVETDGEYGKQAM